MFHFCGWREAWPRSEAASLSGLEVEVTSRQCLGQIGDELRQIWGQPRLGRRVEGGISLQD